MVGASKILTVSYGTFSCTLEGFDDPFNTMRAIAEYFRDLAAEDRYFGAEPPTPDAAMLHRIAEREVQRRVEAKVQDNGVILRAQPDEVSATTVSVVVAEVAAQAYMPATTVAVDVADDEPATITAFAAMLDTAEDEGAADKAFVMPDATQPVLNDMPEGVAARLAKIRAAVALTESAPAPVPDPDYAEDQHADTAFAAFDAFEDTIVPSVSDVSFAAPDDADDSADLAARDDVTATDLPDAAFEAEAVPDAPETAVEPEIEDAIAAASAVDYAVIESADAAAEPLTVGFDDLIDAGRLAAPDTGETGAGPGAEPVAEPAAEFEAADDDVLASLTAAFAEDQPTPATTDADTIVFNDADDLLLDAIMADDAADGSIMAEPDLAVEPAPQDEAEDALSAEEPVAAGADYSDLNDDAPEASPEPEAFPEPEAPVAIAAAPDANDKLQRARARIIRVRRAPDIAIAPAVDAPADTAAAALSDEAEAELQRELAALDDAGASTTETAQDADAAQVFPAPTEDADEELRRMLGAMQTEETIVPVTTTVPAASTTLDSTVQDDSLRRLMDQTQSEMAQPANRRRLSSIAHLKAAVAATIAERFGTRPKPVEEVEAVRTEPYRNDLARAVRPVRPTSTGASERPSPLVLVSEQRIDRPAVVAPAAVTATTGPVTPVRPRRVSAQAVAVQQSYDDEDFDDGDPDTDNIFGDSKGFSEFADRIGASDLSELLEAAAAYSSAVEGREHFTRPQLLRQIASVTGADVSREDELRGFGALLRDGRIVKVKRGQFALTEASTYLDEARKIGD